MTGQKDPVHLYYNLLLGLGFTCVAEVGGIEPESSGFGEPLVKYHPYNVESLT